MHCARLVPKSASYMGMPRALELRASVWYHRVGSSRQRHDETSFCDLCRRAVGRKMLGQGAGVRVGRYLVLGPAGVQRGVRTDVARLSVGRVSNRGHGWTVPRIKV